MSRSNGAVMTRREELIDIIGQNGPITPAEVGKHMRTSKENIHTMVSYNNRMHLKNVEKYPHITNTGIGYTLKPKIEHSMYESGKRIKYAHTHLAIGAPAFHDCKVRNPQYLYYLKTHYNLSGAEIGKLITQQKHRMNHRNK